MMRVVGPLRARGAIIAGAPHPTNAGELARAAGHRAAAAAAASSARSSTRARIERAGQERDPALGPLCARHDVVQGAGALARPHRAHAARARRSAPHGRHDDRARPGRLGRQAAGVRDRRSPATCRRRRSCSSPRRSIPGSRVTVRGVGIEPDAHRAPRDCPAHGRRPRDRSAGRARRRARRRGHRVASAAARHVDRRRGRAARDRRAADRVRACRAGGGTTTIRDAEELRVKESDASPRWPACSALSASRARSFRTDSSSRAGKARSSPRVSRAEAITGLP